MIDIKKSFVSGIPVVAPFQHLLEQLWPDAIVFKVGVVRTADMPLLRKEVAHPFGAIDQTAKSLHILPPLFPLVRILMMASAISTIFGLGAGSIKTFFIGACYI